ncbi:MAG: dipeptide/oligopeptide/nickel ABC transporter ATP-binding protein [Anaerolineales bacterium]|nr:ABC transporter ATP-binding protein [Anaerolineae bacterium]PWB50497.1 MAG: dipeptide/oligopeptide/nickel ABC transporter ATP-binding protein [Anaerolineales bacterium]
MTILDVKNLSICYLTEEDTALNAVERVSFKLEAGCSLGIVGESGCGKTTIILALMRLLPDEGRIIDGQVLFNHTDLLQISEDQMRQVRWGEISMVFQGAMNSLNPVRTVESQIVEALLKHKQVKTKREARERTGELLSLVGIAPERAKQYPHQYSGGMRQRAIIAMALSCNPKILIADEPTTALDVMIQAQITQLLKKLQRELNLALILVTHDLGVVAELCDDVLVMYGGKVAEYASSDIIYNEAKHPYTQRLLKAFPDIDNLTAELVSIPGVPPRLDDLPPGCRFSPRCNLVMDLCSQEPPRLVEFPQHHSIACHLFDQKQSGIQNA